jgi:imidazolonepropionase-like amidohydrolase
VLDIAGSTVTAGFWNSHVHLTTPVFLRSKAAPDAELEKELEQSFTSWGFTTVFDLASTTGISGDVGDRVTSRRVKGPRILSAAEPFYPHGATPIYARPFYEQFNLPSAEVTTDVEAVKRLRRQISDGADGVKLFTGSIVGGETGVVHMDESTISKLSAAARRLKKPVFAHPTDREGVVRAVRDGATILAHTAPLMGPWSREFASWIVSNNVALVPTLSLFGASPHPATPVETAVQQTAAFSRAGGVVLFGTDAGFTDEFDTRAELRLLAGALGWQGVLDSLTSAPAKMFGEGGERGSVLPGYVADLVVLDGDPAESVENLANVRTVIRDGEVVFDR